jgi:integrase
MTKHCASNERIKREYFAYLKEAMRQSGPTVDAVAKAIARFETYMKFRDFKAFNERQAIAFKNHLAEQTALRSGEKLSKATLNSTLASLKKFFHWLAGQPGYKSKFSYSEAEYFNLSKKEVRIASARRDQKAPTLEQVKYVIASMPVDTIIARRNRALVAFTILTGARDGAIASMKLKHVNLVAGNVFQDARDVRTKASKTFTTTFFPIGDDIAGIVEDWISELKTKLHRGNDDPLFPATLVKCGASRQFEVVGLDLKCWSNATPMRYIFKEAFVKAGLSYFNPHSFRSTLVQLGERLCQSPEAFKAWSQNLGHEQVMTTFFSYGEVSGRRQAEIILALGKPQATLPSNAAEIAELVVLKMNEANVRMPAR